MMRGMAEPFHMVLKRLFWLLIDRVTERKSICDAMDEVL
jgi:hypothetical protein